MTLTTEEIIARARSLVGVKFRPQGRDPQIGLDCVGVVLWTFDIPSELIRRDYRLRGSHKAEIESELLRWFAQIRVNDSGAGDVMLFTISGRQNHLAVNCDGSFVHADASLRRVVETPATRRWPLAESFRRRGPGQPE